MLDTVAESEQKDFEFILEIEEEISKTLKNIGEFSQAEEIDRRLKAVREIIVDKV